MMDTNDTDDPNRMLNGNDRNSELKGENLPLYEKREVTVEEDEPADLIYGVTDTPPIHITIISGLQVRPLYNH